VVDPGGTVLAHSDLGKEHVIQRRIERRAGQTPATRLGDGLPALAALLAAVAALALRPRNAQPAPPLDRAVNFPAG
jgi:apolipoprotein N-acyltransferase